MFSVFQINRQLSTKVYEVPYAAKVNEFFRLLKQVALEAEDIEELEEVCFDLDGSFSDEGKICVYLDGMFLNKSKFFL